MLVKLCGKDGVESRVEMPSVSVIAWLAGRGASAGPLVPRPRPGPIPSGLRVWKWCVLPLGVGPSGGCGYYFAFLIIWKSHALKLSSWVFILTVKVGL